MSRDTRIIDATTEDVWTVLADGWLYPSWVVGASRMRSVDHDWPAPGSELHHSVGTWPLLIDDTTTVLASEPRRRLTLRVRAWPAGEGEVEVQLQPVPGAADRTEVTMLERPVAGPGRWVPRPLTEMALHVRNRESLQRLAYLAEGRTDPAQQSAR